MKKMLLSEIADMLRKDLDEETIVRMIKNREVAEIEENGYTTQHNYPDGVYVFASGEDLDGIMFGAKPAPPANKVTIYKNTCTKAFMMSEQGTGFSLSPWGEDTAEYEGYDDGGQEYLLPEGFTVAESKGGTMEIYDEKGKHCTLFKAKNGGPAIIAGDGREVWLKKAPSVADQVRASGDMALADELAVDRDQNWKEGKTTFHFADGSKVTFWDGDVWDD